MKLRTLFPIALAAFAAASCSEALNPSEDGFLKPDEIAFKVQTLDTKAFVETVNTTLKTNGWNCRAVMSNGTEMFNTQLSLSGGVFRDPAFTWYFPSEGTVSFYGVYPTDLSITSENRISYVPDYESDIVAAKAETVAKQSSAIMMNFDHILSQVDINVKGSDSGAVYELQSISVTSPSGGIYDLSSGAWTLDGNVEKNCTLKSGVVTSSSFTQVVEPMSFLPGPAQVRAVWTCKNTGNGTVVGSYDVTADITLEKGLHTTLNLLLPNKAASKITVKTNVSTWNSGSLELNMTDVVDLSMVDYAGNATVASSTANCYVVRADGLYKIPLVYGNAIKDGVTNTSAFYNAAADTKFEDSWCDVFTASSSPYIKEHASKHSVTVGSGEVLWTQGDASVDIVGVDDDYLTISVSDFAPSNSLVAVKDSNGDIMWSWHLWITDQDLSPVTITNAGNRTCNIMPVALGWNGWTHMGNFVYSTAPYYQWGRKDPFSPTDDNFLTDIEENVNVKPTSVNTKGSQGYAHNHPDTFIGRLCSDCQDVHNWTSDKYYYFWDADNTDVDTDSPVVKTIYDPCPAGWQVPQYDTFTGFSLYGAIGSFEGGRTFKKNDSDTEGIFFPAVGGRGYFDGAIYGVGEGGDFWLSVPNDGCRGLELGFGSDGVGPQYFYCRSSGFCVWPAQELSEEIEN